MLFGTTTVLIQQKLLSRPVGYLVQGGMFDALSIVSLIRWEEAVEKLFFLPLSTFLHNALYGSTGVHLMVCSGFREYEDKNCVFLPASTIKCTPAPVDVPGSEVAVRKIPTSAPVTTIIKTQTDDTQIMLQHCWSPVVFL